MKKLTDIQVLELTIAFMYMTRCLNKRGELLKDVTLYYAMGGEPLHPLDPFQFIKELYIEYRLRNNNTNDQPIVTRDADGQPSFVFLRELATAAYNTLYKMYHETYRQGIPFNSEYERHKMILITRSSGETDPNAFDILGLLDDTLNVYFNRKTIDYIGLYLKAVPSLHERFLNWIYERGDKKNIGNIHNTITVKPIQVGKPMALYRPTA